MQSLTATLGGGARKRAQTSQGLRHVRE